MSFNFKKTFTHISYFIICRLIFNTHVNDGIRRIPSSIHLEQLSLYHDMPNPTVASIVERLQSTAVPCGTAWDIHDLLQLPAAIEEQRPLDLETMHIRDVESSISGQPPSVTAGPVGSSDGALEGFLPSTEHRLCNWSASSIRDSGTIVERRRKQNSQAGRQQHAGRVSHRIGG